MKITDESLAVFLAYAKDAGNWAGTPPIGVDGNVCASHYAARKERGNLTQLKRAGLIVTFRSDRHDFIEFTSVGKRLAKEHGINL